MSSECQFCGKTFSSVYVLKTHVSKAKYCLKIQRSKKEADTITERKKNQQEEKIKLQEEKIKLQEEKIKQHRQKIKQHQQKIKGHQQKIKRQTKEIKRYEERLALQKREYEEKIEKLQDRIQELATKAIAKPTTTNNTTNVLNLTPFDMDAKCIKDKIQEKYDFGYFLKGQRGVAEFTKENLLTDKEGNLMYICCDPSRSIFKYKDEKGELRKDVQANRLSKTVTPSILSKAHSLVMEEVENGEEESEEEKNKKNMKHYEMYFKLKEFEDKPQKFGVELSKLVS